MPHMDNDLALLPADYKNRLIKIDIQDIKNHLQQAKWKAALSFDHSVRKQLLYRWCMIGADALLQVAEAKSMDLKSSAKNDRTFHF